MKTNKKYSFVITFFCLFLLIGTNACTKDPSETSFNAAGISDEENVNAGVAELLASMNMYHYKEALPAPDFELTSVKGKRVSLSQYRGKVVLLSFWTTW